MPIKIPDDLPAATTLLEENMFVMFEGRAKTQDIRPLDILIVNIMPTKVTTETQLLRLLSNSPLQVNVTFIQMDSHSSKNISQEYLDRFYKHFDEVKDRNWDGMIITGAPVETLDFEKVDYWNELCTIMDWSTTHVFSTLYICWGAFAGLYHHYGVRKHLLKKKISGVFPHIAKYPGEQLLRGCDDVINIPHSRFTAIDESDVLSNPHLHVLAFGEDTGSSIIISDHGNRVFITGHTEYDADTLANEYERDTLAGLDPDVPANYFPYDNPEKPPSVNWRSTAYLIFGNWLNYYVYQNTPYDLNEIGRD
jgi:homoserine O-succinyltransferase